MSVHGNSDEPTPEGGAPAIDLPALLEHARHGWTLVAVKGKDPGRWGKGWNERTGPTSVDELRSWLDGSAPDYGRGATGCGVLLGPSGLADVDLDCAEGSELGALLLPPTGARWSRDLTAEEIAAKGLTPGAKSHRLYRCTTPPRPLSEGKGGGVALHTGKRQTVIPGSWHEVTGGPIAWDDGATGEPADVDPDELRTAVLMTSVGVWLRPALESGQRHEARLAIGGALAQAGWPREQVERLLGAFRDLGWCEQAGEKEIGSTFDRFAAAQGVTQWAALGGMVDPQALKQAQALAFEVGGRTAEQAAAGDDSRPIVRLNARANYAVDTDRVLEILAAAPRDDRALYCGPAGIVRIVGGELQPVNAATAPEALSRLVHIQRQTDKGIKSVPPPKEVIAALLARGASRLPPLERVSSVPLLRPDGSTVRAPGYDADARAWLLREVAAFPTIGCTKGEALAALGLLRELVADVPFADDLARNGWFAAVLTTVAAPPLTWGGKPLIAPVIYIEANTQGAGKSTLANMAIAIGATQGRRPFGMSCKPGPRGSWVPDEKEVDAALMSGRPMFFDNAIGTLDNPKLATIATSGGCAVRPFHTQQQIDARAVWPMVITTNGGQLGADWTRRVLPVRLEQRTEQRPEWRQPDPCDDLIPEHWQELHAAALTILAAYLAEGQHDEQRTRCKWYGFEPWARLVGDALAWLGADISTLLEQARDYETDRAEVPLIEAIKAYLKASEADGFTVSQLAQPTGPVRADAAEGARVQLCAAIRTAANVAADETLRPHTIGRVLRDHGRAVGNERIANRPRRGRGNVGLWGVKEETPDGPVWWSGKLAAKLAADAEGQAA